MTTTPSKIDQRPAVHRLTVAALAAATLVLAACGDKSPVDSATSAPAETRDPLSVTATPTLLQSLQLGEPGSMEVRETLRMPGRAAIDETRMARVGASVAGRISELRGVPGTDVQRGAVLATLYSTELSNAQLAFLKAYSQRQLAERAAGRADQLFAADVIGAAELQRRQSELVQADAELSAARDQLKVLGMTDKAILKLAASRSITSTSPVVSSIAGTIVERNVTQGQVVQPADTMFIVADLSHLWLVADVPEANASTLRIGEAVQAEFAALPGRRVKGTLSFVSPTVNPETRTVRVRMDLPNPEQAYRPAMLATVLIQGKPNKRQVVPAGAIVREDNRDYVFVQTANDRFVLRQVTLGLEVEEGRVLESGLRDGERIVVDGAFHLNNERKRAELGS